jgi:hypothetical protein
LRRQPFSETFSEITSRGGAGQANAALKSAVAESAAAKSAAEAIAAQETAISDEVDRVAAHESKTSEAVRPASIDLGRRVALVVGNSAYRSVAMLRNPTNDAELAGNALRAALVEIRALLSLGAPAQASCAEVRKIATRHLESVREKLADLTRLEAILAEAVAKCTGETAPVCPVLDILDKSQ